MSVQKLWLATGDKDASEFTAELNANALDPEGAIKRDSDGSLLDPTSISEGIRQAVLVSSLCNVATYVNSHLFHVDPILTSVIIVSARTSRDNGSRRVIPLKLPSRFSP
jgi:hypothetical protein